MHIDTDHIFQNTIFQQQKFKTGGIIFSTTFICFIILAIWPHYLPRQKHVMVGNYMIDTYAISSGLGSSLNVLRSLILCVNFPQNFLLSCFQELGTF